MRNHRVRNNSNTRPPLHPTTYILLPASYTFHPVRFRTQYQFADEQTSEHRFISSGFILLFYRHFWRSVWFFLRQMAPGRLWRPQRKCAETLALFRFFPSPLCSLLFCTLCFKPLLHGSAIYYKSSQKTDSIIHKTIIQL